MIGTILFKRTGIWSRRSLGRGSRSRLLDLSDGSKGRFVLLEVSRHNNIWYNISKSVVVNATHLVDTEAIESAFDKILLTFSGSITANFLVTGFCNLDDTVVDKIMIIFERIRLRCSSYKCRMIIFKRIRL